MFLDELPEFRRHVIDALRQPLEDHAVTIARAQITLSYPARFTLVAAMNPCPCGYLSDSRRTCTCSPAQIRRYRARVSGPLLDRFAGEVFCNAQMITRHLRQHGQLDRDGEALLAKAMDRLGLSARAYDPILKVARTIADLAGADQIRSLDRQRHDDARFAT